MATEEFFDPRHDRACRGNRQLLSHDLEDECSEAVERWQVVHPCPRPEVRSCIDQPSEHRIRVSEELLRRGIGARCPLARWCVGGHDSKQPEGQLFAVKIVCKTAIRPSRTSATSMPLTAGGRSGTPRLKARRPRSRLTWTGPPAENTKSGQRSIRFCARSSKACRPWVVRSGSVQITSSV